MSIRDAVESITTVTTVGTLVAGGTHANVAEDT